MCYNCGCHNRSDDMGNPGNLTDQTIQKLADKWKVSVDEAKHRIFKYVSTTSADAELDQVLDQAAKAWGQSVEEAKRQTYKLLKTELE